MNTRGESSLSFDRAADFYDDTRSHPEDIERSLDLLAKALGGSRVCLEIGVGTGRIALPLSQRGFDIVGVDLSKRMMEKLREKFGDNSSFPLLQVDAAQLCFRDDAFDAAYAVWVLHLIPRWRDALDELVRTVRPKGSIVIAFGGNFGEGPWQEITDRFRAVSGAKNIGAQDVGELDTAMVALGCSVQKLDQAPRVHESPPAEALQRLDQATYSFTWLLEDRTRKEAVAEVRRWAAERYGDLDIPLPNMLSSAWRRYELPG